VSRPAAVVERLRCVWPDAEAIEVVEVTNPAGTRIAVHVIAEGRRKDARLVEVGDHPYSGPIVLVHDETSQAKAEQYRRGDVCSECGLALTVGQPGRHWACALESDRGEP
jgi:hypothetical protein